LERLARETELLRLDDVGLEVSIDDLADVGWPTDRNLVGPVGTVHDERVLCPELEQRRRELLDQPTIADAEHLSSGTGRVRQRPQDVEDRSNADLAPWTTGVLHRRVKKRREHESDPRLGEAVLDPARIE